MPLSGANASSRANDSRAPLQRYVAEEEPHRPRLGDLLDLVEVARGAAPIADAAAEGGAGVEAKGEVSIISGAAQAIDRLVEASAGGARAVARCGGRPLPAVVIERQPEMGAAKGQCVESNIEQDAVSRHPFQCLARPIKGGGVAALGQQQVAIAIAF
jgi:hypothetical protein